MNILIVDNGTSFLKELLRLTNNHNSTVISYKELNLDNIESFDFIILSGGHNFPVKGNEKLLEKEISLVKNTSKPVLGICFGFEIIAEAFGAELNKMKAKEKLILEIKKVKDDQLFENLEDLKVFESHRWVVSDVGDKLVALARSKDGIEIIKHKEKMIYGFQFHPEMFEDRTEGDELFANLIKIVQNQYI